MEICDTVTETEDIFDIKAAVCRKDIPQVMKFDAIEVSEMSDEYDENHNLDKIQDISEEGYKLEENVSEDARITVEGIVEIVALVEDILDPVMVTQDILDTVTVMEDDILETVAVISEGILSFF